MSKAKKKSIFNPWGDEHPEKLNQSPTSKKTIGFADQLKSFVDPDKAVINLQGSTSSESAPSPFENKKLPRNKEFVIFAHQKKEKEVSIQQETQMILNELQQQVAKLQSAEKSLTKEVSKVNVEQIPQKSGIYYLIFFEWLIGVVKQLRIKVENGKSWLQAFNQRCKKKRGYWQMFKKHGTTFGMSHERGIATSVG